MPALDQGSRKVATRRTRKLAAEAARAASEAEARPKAPRPTRAERRALRTAARSHRRPSPRGWLGRARGETVLVQPAPEWRGTTVQVCGLWPYAVGSSSPISGVPLGLHLDTGATVCADPIS
ncbi:hypothetical protein ACAD32_02677 [Clavibacter nebraskensis]